MEELYELKDKLCKELRNYSSEDLTVGTLQTIDLLTHSIKSLVTIIAMEDGGYSNDGYEHGNSYGYDRGYSGRRYANRDSMGRYVSRDNYSGGYYGNSYDDRLTMNCGA